MFQKRMESGKDVYLHEFMYPLMQGYDSIAMDVDGEVGGNDQMFNMLVGRDLMKRISNKEKYVLTLKLLLDGSGEKMGKTTGNMLSLSDTANEMYGTIMSWPDESIIPSLELCTFVPMEEINEVKTRLEKGDNPRDEKMKLAYEVVKIYHNEADAEKAQESFVNAFQKKGIPESITEINAMGGENLVDILLEQEMVKSKSDFRRLISENAISIDGEKISDDKIQVTQSIIVKVGKHRFLKINT